jgi:1,4-dihydroxy-2-naphthoate octaprenyltransferase
VLRLRFVPASLFPALLGTAVAWKMTGSVHIALFLVVLLGLSQNHVGLNMIDDVFDFLHAADRTPSEGKNPYTGGSGVLTEGLLFPFRRLGRRLACFAATAAVAVYLAFAAGWPVLLLAGMGIFSSVFYAVPPVRYGYRGLGELAHVINFGPVIVLGAFYVQTGTFAPEPLMASFVPGFLMGAMIVANEIRTQGLTIRRDRTPWSSVTGKTAVSLYGARLRGLGLCPVRDFPAASPGRSLVCRGPPGLPLVENTQDRL